MTFTDNTPAVPARVKSNSSGDERFLPARRVWERYGVSDMTLHRWVRDDEMGFPAPVYFGRFRYWNITDLREWERQQAAKRGAK